MSHCCVADWNCILLTDVIPFFVVPHSFTLLFNATRYDSTIQVSEPVAKGIFLFGIKVFVDSYSLPDDAAIDSLTTWLILTLKYGQKFYFKGQGGPVAAFIIDTEQFYAFEFKVTSGVILDFGLHQNEITAFIATIQNDVQRYVSSTK